MCSKCMCLNWLCKQLESSHVKNIYTYKMTRWKTSQWIFYPPIITYSFTHVSIILKHELKSQWIVGLNFDNGKTLDQHDLCHQLVTNQIWSFFFTKKNHLCCPIQQLKTISTFWSWLENDIYHLVATKSHLHYWLDSKNGHQL
jgi:hypothetical protein